MLLPTVLLSPKGFDLLPKFPENLVSAKALGLWFNASDGD